jgi:hypothetical protein
MTAAPQKDGDPASPQSSPQNEQEIGGDDAQEVRNRAAYCEKNRAATGQEHSGGPQGKTSCTSDASAWPEQVKDQQDDATGKLGNHNAGKQCRYVERHEKVGLAIKALNLDRQS